MTGDRNFDELAEHFERRIYGGLKGRVRLEVLRRDLELGLAQLGEGEMLQVLDAGAGLAQLALELAAAGHRVTVNDLSARMLTEARKRAAVLGLQSEIEWCHGPLQALGQSAGQAHADGAGRSWDLVLCHAVLEWLADPRGAVEPLGRLVRPGGLLSLAFYNRDAQVFRNLVRGNFKRVRSGVVRGEQGGLTPLHPLCPQAVAEWLEQAGFEVVMRTGIRVFRDYVSQPTGGNLDEDEVVAMELSCSGQEPFWRLGRYVHYLCRRVPETGE